MREKLEQLRKRYSLNEDGFTAIEVIVASAVFLVLIGIVGSMFLSAYRTTDVISTSSFSEAELVNGSNKLVKEITNGTEFISAGTDWVRLKSVDDQGQNTSALRQEVTYFYYNPDTTTTAKLTAMGLPSGITLPDAKGLLEYRVTSPDADGNVRLQPSLTMLMPNISEPTTSNPLFAYYALNNQQIPFGTYGGFTQVSSADVPDIIRVQIHFEAQPTNRDSVLEINTSASPKWLGGGYEDNPGDGGNDNPDVPPPSTTVAGCVSNSNGGNTATTGITVNWSAISGAEGYSIYRSNRNDAGFPSFNKISDVNGRTTTSWTDTAIRPGEVYRYQVRAWGDGGESALSNVTTCYTIAGTPTSPIADEVNASQSNANNSIDVKYDKQSNQRVTHYEIQKRVNWAGSWVDMPDDVISAANYETDTGLRTTTEANVGLGDRRDYRVRVCNEAGCSAWTSASNAGTAADNDDYGIMRLPAAPGCTVTSATTRSLDVRVNPAASPNSTNVIKTYRIHDNSNTSTYQNYSSRGPHTYSDRLSDNTSRTYSARVENDRGWSTEGSDCTGTTNYLEPVTGCSFTGGGPAPSTIVVTASGSSASYRQTKIGSGSWRYGTTSSYQSSPGLYTGYARASDGWNYSNSVSCTVRLTEPMPGGPGTCSVYGGITQTPNYANAGSAQIYLRFCDIRNAVGVDRWSGSVVWTTFGYGSFSIGPTWTHQWLFDTGAIWSANYVQSYDQITKWGLAQPWIAGEPDYYGNLAHGNGGITGTNDFYGVNIYGGVYIASGNVDTSSPVTAAKLTTGNIYGSNLW